MFCYKCGVEVSETANFCKKCGTKLKNTESSPLISNNEKAMKKIICEACGSVDIIKQDGLFVCQSCGCKYEPEEVRKLVIEQPIIIEKTIIEDKTDLLENYQTLADEAYTDENYEEAYTYYLKVLEINPNDLNAKFYKELCVARKNMTKNCNYENFLVPFKVLIDSEEDGLKRMLYCHDIINFTYDWQDMNMWKRLDIHDWYENNINIFWKEVEDSHMIIEILDELKDILLEHGWQIPTQLGKIYCESCKRACDYVVQWKDSNQYAEEAELVGYSLSVKKIYIRRYDEMTYLMRKQGEKDFNKCKEEDIFKNVIERFEKPKQVSPSNEALIRRNEQECIRISEEIDKRIISEGGYKNS